MEFERFGDFHFGVGEEIVYNNQKLVGAFFFFVKMFSSLEPKMFSLGREGDVYFRI